jgi:CubicO group peptidase (beta-lactamase class C family)
MLDPSFVDGKNDCMLFLPARGRFARLLLSAGLIWGMASAQVPAPAQQGPRDRAELGAFFDGLYAGLEHAHHLSGMTVAVVRDGEVILLKGYGYADIEKRKPVDPERTLFRIGSITKTLTWTALMQLSAESRIDLNGSVDRLLPEDLVIRSPWKVSPTVHDLMDHTPGYDDVPVVGLFRHQPYRGVLKDALLETMPVIVRKPGEMVSYSNYGAALAGLIVERVSNVRWESYVQNAILTPLEMAAATAEQPVPPELAAQAATGYRWRDGELKAQGFEYVPLAPAGGASASASAMAHFMLAHLQDGRYGNERILPEWAARQMHEPLYRAAPQLGAWLHGLYELRAASPRVYGHGGDTLWFHSLMALFPETNTGLFVSFNSDSGAAARSDVYKAFLAHYYPQPEQKTPKLLAGAAGRGAASSGWFVSTRLARRTPARMMALMNTLSIDREGPNRLAVRGPALPGPMHFIEVEPWVYREIRGQELLVMRPVQGGSPRYAFLASNPGSAFERVSALWSPPVQLSIAGLAGLGILISLFAYPIVAVRDAILGLRPDSRVKASHVVAWMASAALSVGILCFLAYMRDPQELVFGIPGSLGAAGWCARIGSALTVLSAASVVILWARGFGRTGGRVAHSLTVVCQVTLALWTIRWGLIG